MSVPDPVFASLAPAVGQAFMGYRMIRGEAATLEEFAAFDGDETRLPVATQLAHFLNELHGVPVNEAFGIDIPRYDTHSEWAGMYTRVRKRLFPYMRTDAQEWTAQHFEAFLGEAGSFEYDPVLRHGDFGPDNIIVDKETWTGHVPSSGVRVRHPVDIV